MNDISDERITFDARGFCNYCNQALSIKDKVYFPNEQGKNELERMIMAIKKDGEGHEYDCMMGLSGGLDSSYLAYLGHSWGLRILGVHLDDGFNTDLASSNVQKLVEKCGIKLVVIKPNPKQFYDLTLSFFRASVPNLAIPQDNIIYSALLKHAAENNIKYNLSGVNFALECILQRGNTHPYYDLIHIKAIHKLYGKRPISDLPLISWKDRGKYSKKLGIKTLTPLNFVNYNKEKAIQELKAFCDYDYYEAKHFESIFTRFLQAYYLPQKFNVDKRTSHLSSLVVTGQLLREDALKELRNDTYSKYADSDIAIIIDKLEISKKEFNEIMALPPKQHLDYKTDFLLRLKSHLGKIKSRLTKA